ncbi:MAG: ATP-binding protein, partial [Gammaproteobacteria bacterium]|nr:ATP-binding protein [Gammaproteobacteria bacterium]
MARPDRSDEIENALLAHVEAHPNDLVRVVANRLGLSRAAVAASARVLIANGYLAKTGTTRPTYRLGTNRSAIISHRLAGLEEDRVWTRDVAPHLVGLPANIIDISHYGLTEMVNNAIDHAEGERLQVLVDRNMSRLAVMVSDDGIGIFRKITRALQLPDERLALLELSKGKLTTDPRRHSGEGVFFTSRMFDHFQIASNDLVFDHNTTVGDDLLYDIDPHYRRCGTTVLMEIAIDASRTAKQVFDEFSSGPD